MVATGREEKARQSGQVRGFLGVQQARPSPLESELVVQHPRKIRREAAPARPQLALSAQVLHEKGNEKFGNDFQTSLE